MAIENWVFSDKTPGDFYELIGAKRFEPNRASLLRDLRAAVRRLMQFEGHQDPAVAKRAVRLQQETSTADRVLRDHDLLRRTHLQMLQVLLEEWTAVKSAGGDLAAWLRTRNVHPERVAVVAPALANGRLADVLTTLDWTDPVEPTPAATAPAATPARSAGDHPPIPKARPVSRAPLAPQARGASPRSDHRETPNPAATPTAVAPKPSRAEDPEPFIPSIVVPRKASWKSRARLAAVLVLLVAAGGAAVVFSGLTGRRPPWETATPPSLSAMTDLVIDEERPLEHVFSVADDPGDIAAHELELIGTIPSDLKFSAAERRISWTPTERDGPGSFPLEVRLRRKRWYADDETRSFKIVVREVNRPPQVRNPLSLVGTPGQTVSGRIDLFDPDLPPNAVRMELLDETAGASVDDSAPGSITLPAGDRAGQTTDVIVRLVDDGTPPASTNTIVSVSTRPSFASTSPSNFTPTASPLGTSPPAVPASTPPPSAIAGNTPATAVPDSGRPPPAAASPSAAPPIATAPTVPPPSTAAAIVVTNRPKELNLERFAKAFETDFSTEAAEFPSRSSDSLSVSTRDGVLHVEHVGDEDRPSPAFLGSGASYPVSDFACEIRVRFAGNGRCSSAITLGSSSRDSFSVSSDASDRFRLMRDSGSLPTGALSLRKNEWHTLLLVVRNRTATGYFDGAPVGKPAPISDDTTVPTTSRLFLLAYKGGVCELDHFTVWDLSKNVAPTTTVAATPPATPGPDPGPRLQPKWLFAANGSWRYRIVDTEKVDRPSAVNAEIRQITAVQTFEITVKVTSVDARGAANLLVTVDRVQGAGDWSPSISVSINGGITYFRTFRHDTQGNMPQEEVAKPSAEALDKLVGATLTMQMLPDGRILNVKGSPQIQTAEQYPMWLMIGGAPWDNVRLQRSLTSWAVNLPDDREFKAGRWNRTLPACFWRELPPNVNTFFTLKPPVNGDANSPLEFDADYRTGPRRSGAAAAKNEDPTGTFIFDAVPGRLKSAARKFSLVRAAPGGNIEMTLTNSVESIP